jgi:hypothetical protein
MAKSSRTRVLRQLATESLVDMRNCATASVYESSPDQFLSVGDLSAIWTVT